MPGRLIQRRPVTEVAASLGWAGALPQGGAGLRAPGQEIVVWGREGLGLARWGMIPVGRVNARGRPVMEMIVNARSETVFDKSAYRGTGRGIVPVDGWIEWSGSAGRKEMWEIAPADGAMMLIAAITDDWIAPDGRKLRQVATLTCGPNADVGRLHDRMCCVLQANEVAAWLDGAEEEGRALLRPLPDGVLSCRRAGGT